MVALSILTCNNIHILIPVKDLSYTPIEGELAHFADMLVLHIILSQLSLPVWGVIH